MKCCPHCGQEIPAEMGYCLLCMARLDPTQTAEPPRRKQRWLLPVVCVAVVLIAGMIGAALLSREKKPASGKLPTAGQTTVSTTTSTTTAHKDEMQIYLADLVGMPFGYVKTGMGDDFTYYEGDGLGCVYKERGLIFYYEYPEGELTDDAVCIVAEMVGDHYIAGDIHTAMSVSDLQMTALAYGAYNVGSYESPAEADKTVVTFTFVRDGNLYEVYATYAYGADAPETVRLKYSGEAQVY